MKKRCIMGCGRFVLTLAFVGVLIGCETIESTRLELSAPTDATFGPDQQSGAVIIGIDHDNWLPSFPPDVQTLVFWTYDPGAKRLIPPEQGGTVIRWWRGTQFMNHNIPGGIQYILQLFPAGDYYLTTVTWGPYGVAYLADGSIAFSVKPETVTYVGNVDFKTPPLIFLAVDLVLLGRDDAAAKSLLAKYPALDGEIWHQTLEPFQLDCNMKDGLTPCFRAAGS